MYGCLVIGPSGSGKTTFCQGLQQFFNQIERKNIIVNLDPANDTMSYKPNVDIRDLINLSEVMEELQLGPNGSLIYAIKFLNENMEWLKNQLEEFKDQYIIFDLPGQIELYVNNVDMKSVMSELAKYIQLVSVALFDSLHCYDNYSFISASCMALSIMVQLETPHINVLSKIDLLKKHGSLPNSIRFYLDCNDMKYMGEGLDQSNQYNKLNKNICELVENYSMVGFTPLHGTFFIVSGEQASYVQSYHFDGQIKRSAKEKFKDLRMQLFQSEEANISELIMDIEEDQYDDIDDRMHDELFN